MENSLSGRSSGKLQREMVRKNSIFRSNTEKILKDYNKKLPQLPNEEKIEKKLEDEEELLVLYKQMKEKENQIRAKRQNMIKNKLIEIEESKKGLFTRFKELEGNESKRQEKKSDKLELVKMKRELQKQKKLDHENKLNMLLMKKEFEVEKLFLKKREYEKIIERKKQIFDKKKKLKAQMIVLAEEEELKDINSKRFLERALQKGTLIEQTLLEKGALSPQEAADLVKALMDRKSEELKEKQDLIDKLYQAKLREKRQNELKAQEKIKELNKIKAELKEKEMKVLEEKAVHEKLRGRGVDFLTEIEMGNAPPIEAIKKNLKYNPKEARKKRTREQVVKLSEDIAKYGEDRLAKLREELDRQRKSMGMDEKWREEMKQFFQNCNPDSYQIAKSIMIHIMDRVFADIDEKEENRINIKQRRDALLQKKRKFDRNIREIKHRSAVKMIRDDILNRIVSEMALETVKENMYISKKIDYKMVDILVKALQLEKDSNTNGDDLRVLASNVEDDTLLAAREALMNQFKDVENPQKEDLNQTFEERLFEIDQDVEDDRAVLDPARMDMIERCNLI